MITTIKNLDKKYFSRGNVCVDGLRGRGKDMLMSNVIYRRNEPYISNIDYKCRTKKMSGNVCIPLDLSSIDVKNNYKNFVTDKIIPYDYPYPEHCDLWISDSQLYFPSQYNGELNKLYPNIPNFLALSRQLGNANIHINTQNLNRVWDKIREQSDFYIKCRDCKVLGKLVIQKITVYDKAQSCIDRVDPFRPLKAPIFSKQEAKAMYRTKNEELLRKFKETYGCVRNYTLIYINRSKYDTRLFKSILKGGNSND
ncbi:MAG: hypothetical protein IJA97_06400 [Clostridia bacterium]|nr:hypothetical protein [Clostridia bacterium]